MTWSETIAWWATPVLLIGTLIAVVIILAVKRKWTAAIVTSVVSFLLVAVSGSSYFPARYAAQKNACLHNLRQIKEAKANWAKEKEKAAPDEPLQTDLGDWFKGVLPRCPSDGSKYRLGRLGENPSCINAKRRGHVLP